MWARLARWNRGIANAIGSLIVSKSGGARRVETRDPTREFKASRRNSGRVRLGKAVKLKVGGDRDRNGRGATEDILYLCTSEYEDFQSKRR